MSYWIILIGFMLCIGVLPWAMIAAEYIGLVDRPSGRKRHIGSTPLVGGLCIYTAFVLSLCVYPDAVSWSMMAWFGLVLVIGIVDDFSDISHRIRLLVHSGIVVGIFITDSSYVSNIGAVLGNGDIKFAGLVALFFTIVGVIGAINAVNMSDGVDGLLTTLIVISLLAVLFVTSNDYENTGFINRHGIWALVGACMAFLILNSRVYAKKAIVFLGDAGSTTIGFILVYILIQYSQGPNAAFSATLAGWIVGLPLLDSSAVIVNRLRSGKSPVKADRSHLHYLLVDNGYSVNSTVLLLCVIHACMIFTAIAINATGSQYSDAVLFWGFIGLVFARLVICSRVFGSYKEDSIGTKIDRVEINQPPINAMLGTSERFEGDAKTNKARSVENKVPN